ncbi:FAD-binding protein [Tessaracoccus antarcticus]|uniref:FAD-binding protein n=1 Tax=Tessaracoccus antarcticus TaxID=2479848 RepID=A0A3M0FYL0_9ACTN|nr:FAD-binding protein [Tessaracoccus antarcticus]RMB57801.1 FAD-binding protein [Tessaracoccus antarcticus]
MESTTQGSAVGRNWAGNIAYGATRLVEPGSVDELVDLVASEARVRVLGSRHSFNDLADTDAVLVSLAAIAGNSEVLRIDEKTIRVPAGMRYGDLVPTLERWGVALANLASLPHISVGGAVQTGTHGSGDRIGSLATQVAGLQMITGAGEQVHRSRGDDDFDGAVVALGALGIVTQIDLDVEPTYEVAQSVWEGARWDDVLEDLDAVTTAGNSVSFFTTWQDRDAIDQVWVKTRTSATPAGLPLPGVRTADGERHPIPGINPEPCTRQQGVPGPWFDRLPHFRLAFTPSVGEELQTEYLLPRKDAVAAIEAVRGFAHEIAPLLHVSEIRTMAGDDLWLSPAYGSPTVALHFTWKPDEEAVRGLLPRLEAALPASARPHWGKVFTMAPNVIAARYPRWDDYRDLVSRLDPQRRFVNPYLARLGL